MKIFSKNLRWIKRLRGGGLILVEFVAGIILAMALAVAIIAWRLSSGDIAVDFLASPIENAVNDQLDGYSIQIGGAVLQQSDTGYGFSFRLNAIKLNDVSGVLVAEAPKAAIGIDPESLLYARVSPTYIDLIGPKLVLVYRRDGRLVIDMDRKISGAGFATDKNQEILAERDPEPVHDDGKSGEFSESPAAVDGVRSLLGLDDTGSSPLNTLSRIGVRDANLIFVHERLGLRWEIQHSEFTMTREENSVVYTIQAQIADDRAVGPLKVSGVISGQDGGLVISSMVDQFNPRVSAKHIDGLGGLAALDLPVSVEFGILISADGSVKHLDMNTEFAAGFIRLTEDEGDPGILIDEANLALNFDAEKKRIEILPSSFYSGNNSALFVGTIVASSVDGQDFWRYTLSSSEAKLSSADIQEPAIDVGSASFSGSYEPQSGDFWLDEGEVVSEEASFTIAGRMRTADISPSLDVFVKLTPMSVSAVKQIWPSFLATGAREWINENVISGSIIDGLIEAHFPPGLIADLIDGGDIPDDALNISFEFEDTTLRYFRPLPLLQNLRGHGTMRGGHFTLDGENGAIFVASGNKVERISGHVEIPVVTADKPIAYVNVNGQGGSSAVLELLDYPPLEYAQDIGIFPADISGDTVVELDLSIPLLRDIKFADVNIAAKATASQLTGRALFAGQDITNGTLDIEVLPTRIEVGGVVQVAGVSVDVQWQRPFGRGRADPGKLIMRARLDQDDRKRLGLDFEAVSGPITIEARPSGSAGVGTDLDVNIDLAEAHIRFDAMSWQKPPGLASNASFHLLAQEAGELKLESFQFAGGGATMSGVVDLDPTGNILRAELPTFRLRRDDNLSLNLTRSENGQIDVTVRGKSANASDIIREYFTLAAGNTSHAQGDAAPDRIRVDASIDRVKGLSNDVMTDMKMTLEIQGDLVERMSLNGQITGASVVATITPRNEQNDRKLKIESRDAGAAFRYVGLYSRISRGKLNVVAYLPRNPGLPVVGDLITEEFFLTSDRVIQQITEGSQTSNQPQIETRGIYFNRLHMPFVRNAGALRLKESYLRGPSLGATFSGIIDFDQNKLNISGTYVPLYAVNNLLSHVPLFGQILTGGRNEGVLGITFLVTGPAQDPTVTVNPISVMAPGVFRKLFNFSNAGAGSPATPTPDAANEGNR